MKARALRSLLFAGFALWSTGAEAACGDVAVDDVVEKTPVPDAGSRGGPGAASGEDASDDDLAVDSGSAPDAGTHVGAGDVVDAGAVTDPAPGSDFAARTWQTGDDVGFGVAFKDSENPRGEDIFVGYGGFGVTLDDACAWVTALYEATLEHRGVRYVYCVQGPATVRYEGLEIGNVRLARRLVAQVGPRTRFVLVAGHSSGSFVAHELLRQLDERLDPEDVTAGRIVYFDLDGGASGLTASSVQRLRRAYFVGAVDGSTGTASPNRARMISLGATHAGIGAYLNLDATGSGCVATGVWCVHMTPISTRPHDPAGSDTVRDYRDFAGRAVTTAWIDAVATEAGLLPP